MCVWERDHTFGDITVTVTYNKVIIVYNYRPPKLTGCRVQDIWAHSVIQERLTHIKDDMLIDVVMWVLFRMTDEILAL